MSLFLPSGGLIWHARAWRFGRDWQNYRQALAGWLRHWRHGRRDILLLGPSAGWCLNGEFLRRHRSIVAVDIDPLAPFLFRLRHGAGLRRSRISMHWHALDVFSHLEALLQRYPSHAILFCNLLGQHIVHSRNADHTSATLGLLRHQLRGRAWASFHDCLSKSWSPAEDWPLALELPHKTTLLDIADRAGVAGQWQEHLTTEVLPGHLPRCYFPWRITPDRMHIIEAGAVAC